MSNTHPRRKRTTVSLGTIAHRGAMPFFLFSLVLFSLLTTSHFFVLPNLTSVEVGGAERDAQELRAYHASLLQEISEKEGEREALVFPMEDSAYRRLVDKKHTQFPILSLRSSLIQTAKQVLPDQADVVHIESIRYMPEKRRVELTGDVRNVGPRSMTVLAQLVEQLKAEPFVEEVVSPRFERLQSPRIGMHSPFVFKIKLL